MLNAAEGGRPDPPRQTESDGIGRVLIAEDDAAIRRLLSIILQRTGVPHDTVADGKTAMRMMEDRHYDVLLLDLMMPMLSGYQVVEYLRRDERRPKTIIVMTAANDADLNRLDASIVTDVIRKPFDVEAVAAMIGAAARAAVRP